MSKSAIPGGSGTSWTDAYQFLQDALGDAASGDQIWVTQGVYYPDEGAGRTDNSDTETFQLLAGVEIYGGFPSFATDTDDFEQRDFEQFLTVLSGNIDGNDTTDENGLVTDVDDISGNNANHVVTGTGTDSSALLDGFSITAGDANEVGAPGSMGGGLLNFQSGSQTIRNVTFIGNRSMHDGGAVWNREGASPTFENVRFIANESAAGGAMENSINCSPLLTNVTFVRNHAGQGGAIYNHINSHPSLNNVTFEKNTSDNDGGAFYNNGSNPTLTNVGFYGNHSEANCGGMFNQGGSPVLQNVVFSDNDTGPGGSGGGMFNNVGGNAILINVTFAYNSSGIGGGGMYNVGDSIPVIKNSVFWENISPAVAQSDQIQNENSGSGSRLVDCLIQAGCPDHSDCDDGELLSMDPMFADADGRDNMPGTRDDDLRLFPGSPAIDKGNDDHVPEEVVTDFVGNPRIIGTVDMGAYEFAGITNLQAGGGKGTIRLIWDRSPLEGVLGYNVYRSDESSDFSEKTRINPELLVDPVYLDGTTDALVAGEDYYYQIETVVGTSPEVLTVVSQEISGTESKYVMRLPDLRAFQTPPNIYIPYPISTLNARGIAENNFQILVKYPEFVEIKETSPSVADFETTALTENYQNLSSFHNNVQKTVLIQDLISQPGSNELTGEGHFVNLLIRVKPGIPEGRTGAFEFQDVIFRDASNQPVSVDKSDNGILTVANSFRFGDVNGKGDILLTDQEAAAKLVIGAPTDEVVKTAADLNADGVVDIADIVLFPERFGTKKKSRSIVRASTKGGQNEFIIRFKDTSFPSLPGEVDAFISLDRPPSDSIGVAGVAFTINYSTEAVEFVGMDAVGGFSPDNLFYTPRDYARRWRPGQVRVALTASANKPIEGDVMKVRFKSRPSASVNITDVKLNTGKIARLSGEDLSWNNTIRLVNGHIFFGSPTPTATPLNPDVAPTNAPDGKVDARDLLIFLSNIRDTTEPVLFEFARFWGGPFP